MTAPKPSYYRRATIDGKTKLVSKSFDFVDRYLRKHKKIPRGADLFFHDGKYYYTTKHIVARVKYEAFKDKACTKRARV